MKKHKHRSQGIKKRRTAKPNSLKNNLRVKLFLQDFQCENLVFTPDAFGSRFTHQYKKCPGKKPETKQNVKTLSANKNSQYGIPTSTSKIVQNVIMGPHVSSSRVLPRCQNCPPRCQNGGTKGPNWGKKAGGRGRSR